MKNGRDVKKVTRAEQAYIHDLRARSALDGLDGGSARLIEARDYPEPLKRFLRREKRTVHVELTPSTRRRLEEESRKRGVTVHELARRCIERSLRRDVG